MSKIYPFVQVLARDIWGDISGSEILTDKINARVKEEFTTWSLLWMKSSTHEEWEVLRFLCYPEEKSQSQKYSLKYLVKFVQYT